MHVMRLQGVNLLGLGSPCLGHALRLGCKSLVMQEQWGGGGGGGEGLEEMRGQLAEEGVDMPGLCVCRVLAGCSHPVKVALV